LFPFSNGVGSLSFRRALARSSYHCSLRGELTWVRFTWLLTFLGPRALLRAICLAIQESPAFFFCIDGPPSFIPGLNQPSQGPVVLTFSLCPSTRRLPDWFVSITESPHWPSGPLLTQLFPLSLVTPVLSAIHLFEAIPCFRTPLLFYFTSLSSF